MARLWRVVLFATLCSAVLATGADAKKPLLTNTCQLVTTAQVKAIMGRPMQSGQVGDPTFCGWKSGFKANAGITVYGFKSVAGAKQRHDFDVKGFDLCEGGPEHFLPGSGLGADAWFGCGSNIAFRLGRFAGETVTYTDDVAEGSNADTHRTAALTRKVVKALRRHRCSKAFCRI